MILPEWFSPILIGIDVLVMIYGLHAAVNKKKAYGWFLALAFFLFGIKEVLQYNGVILQPIPVLALSVAGLVAALCAFYLVIRSLPS